MEIENDGYGEFSDIRDLVNVLNAYEDKSDNITYAFIDPGLQKLVNQEVLQPLQRKNQILIYWGRLHSTL